MGSKPTSLMPPRSVTSPSKGRVGENRNMAKGTLKDLVRLAKIWRMPLSLMILCFKDERKGSKNDAEALESLIENLAEGSIS